MKLFKLKLILGILVPALFISSCSSPRLDELTVRETALQKGIKAKTDNCELVWLLETYASWAEIDLYSLEPSEATNIASKLKNYTQDVLNLNKSDLNLGPEYFNDLGFVLEKISSTDLAARFLREIGRTYFPTCGYFSVDEALEIPLEQESQPENTQAVNGNREACRIYYEAYDEAMQLPFNSPKLSYVLQNGRREAIKYADPELALNFQILIDGGPNSTDVVFDIYKICDQYR